MANKGKLGFLIDQVRSCSRSDGGCSKGCSEKWWELDILKVGLMMASGCDERERERFGLCSWKLCCGGVVELCCGEDGVFGLAVSLWGCPLASRVELKWTPELCLRGEGSPSGWGCLFGGHCVSGALYREHWSEYLGSGGGRV